MTEPLSNRTMELTSPLRFMKGVGPARADALERLGLVTLEDLLFFFPRRYEDRRTVLPLAGAQKESFGAFRATVVSWSRNRTARKGMNMLRATLTDGRSVATAVWFNRQGLERVLVTGTELALWSRVSSSGRTVELINPEIEVLRDGAEPTVIGSILPVYPGTAGLPDRWLRRLVNAGLDAGLELLGETLPDEFLKERNWPGVRQAVSEMHRPTSRAEWLAARTRLSFEEFLWLQVGMALRQSDHDRGRAAPVLEGGIRSLRAAFLERLAFDLTDDQRTALTEIDGDLARHVPMNRLLQGDVGSGKTVVALLAMLRAVESGRQAAIMAPTQVLAFQHFQTLERWLSPLGVTVSLLSGGLKATERQKLLDDLKTGHLDLVVGTHALVQEGVEFADLGLVVIDEQHRFGVLQRRTLAAQSGGEPHRLVMTATPIPRTLALSIYGDLSLSTIRQMPRGRLPIKTSWIKGAGRQRMMAWLDGEMARGRQVYWICPLIEENEELDATPLERRSAELREAFPLRSVGVLHGRMSGEQKADAMAEFTSGAIDLLAATTVVEVGVDVPNATVMVIEDADRFGLSQLHQLRGRVGRGTEQSWCFLLSGARGEAARRLEAFCGTTDGFEIADIDMALRGPGEFCGVRQHGLTDFRVADLLKDARLMDEARVAARSMVARNSVPELLMAQVKRRYGALLDLMETA